MSRRAWNWAAAVLLFSAGCAGDPGEALSRHYGTALPQGVRVTNFTGEAFKDPWFLWEIRPADASFLKTLVANAKLKPAPMEMSREDVFTLGKARWWPTDAMGSLNEMYYLDQDSSYWRVWVDRKANRLWVLFFNM